MSTAEIIRELGTNLAGRPSATFIVVVDGQREFFCNSERAAIDWARSKGFSRILNMVRAIEVA